MEQIEVTAVWHSDSGIDELAHELSYRVLGDDWSTWEHRTAVFGEDDKVRAAEFAAARKEWNEWLNRMVRGGYLTQSQENNLRYCRYPGVIINRPVPKFACRHVCCPYCHYRWVSNTLRKHKWLLSDYLDLVAWQIEIKHEKLLNRVDRNNVINNPVKANRKLLKRVLSPGKGISICRLWIDEFAAVPTYYAQVLFIGIGLRRDVSEAVEELDAFERPEYLQTHFEQPRDVVLGCLRYNKSYLRIPGKMIAPIKAWRSSFQIDKLRNEA